MLRRDEDMADLKRKASGDANLIVKLQMHIRQLVQRIEELEDELDQEMKLRLKVGKFFGHVPGNIWRNFFLTKSCNKVRVHYL